MTFARFLDQITRLRTQFFDYTIKKVRLVNAGEFMSQVFNDYCMSIRLLLSIMLPIYLYKMN